ncbi:MAG: hypothetical protein VX498_10840, partial [Myxococcota bacterium]|nr:hypothetical protein [Myxococcota bacterium]
RAENAAEKRIERLQKEADKHRGKADKARERELQAREEHFGRERAELQARIDDLEDVIATAQQPATELKTAVEERDSQIVQLEVQLAEAIASASGGEAADLLVEKDARIAQLEEQLDQVDDERTRELEAVEGQLNTTITQLEEQLASADQQHEAEVDRLEAELDAARSSTTGQVGPEAAEEAAELLAARDKKIEQKNKKLQFIAEQLEGRDAQVIELEEKTTELETELAGLRKILARKKEKTEAPEAAPTGRPGLDLSAIQPKLDELNEAVTKLDKHLAGGIDDWKELELFMGGAVTQLIRVTSKDPGLQKVVNPLLEQLQTSLETGRKIVEESRDLVVEERKSLTELSDVISDD